MALNNIIRRFSASKVVPLAIRVIGGSQRYYHHSAAILSAVSRSGGSCGDLCVGKFCKCSLPSAFHRFSTKPVSDESLIQVLKDEIESAEGAEGVDKVDEAPNGFPFKIEDIPGQTTITLSREYQGETIVVEVDMPSLITGDENEDDDQDDDNDEQASSSQIPLIVRVSRKNGPSLEFSCTAYPDEISIDGLSIKDPNSSEDQLPYEGPDFSDLDENLQKAFHKYLEIRGIKPSATNFLHEYMINKDSREYLLWLEKVKQFVQA